MKVLRRRQLLIRHKLKISGLLCAFAPLRDFIFTQRRRAAKGLNQNIYFKTKKL